MLNMLTLWTDRINTIWNMADTYAKLFGSILDSTVWQESLPTKVVWITMLAMKDRNGYVGAAIPGLAKRAGVSVEECEGALTKFLSPDPYSRSKEHNGRRIEVSDGGWTVLNHEKYRQKMSLEDRREYKRQKQAEYRAKASPKESRKAKQLRLNEDAKERAFVKAEENGDLERAGRIAAGEES